MNAEYNMKINIGNIIDSISYQNDEYIYLMDYERNGENKFDKIYAKSIIVGITKDNGGSWKFIDIDKDYLPQTKELLSAIYPANIVDRIFKSIDTGLNISKEEIGFTPTDDIEINLQKQFNSYMNAFYYGNEDEVLNFIYPGVFENLKDVLQEEHSLNELKSIFKESYINIRREQVGNKKYEMRVSKILNKVEYENSLIYALSYYLKSGIQNDYLSVGGELIAISTDNGRSWKFFERDQESAIPILAKKFPDQIITKALNYEYEK